MEFLTEDHDLTIPEIEQFIDKVDDKGVFNTRFYWHKNFMLHFKQVLDAGHIVTFRDNGELAGFCSWGVMTKNGRQGICKTRWILPENIITGPILYIDVCLLTPGASIFKIKDFLSQKYRSVVEEVFWYDIPHNRIFELILKGGGPCQKGQTAGCRLLKRSPR